MDEVERMVTPKTIRMSVETDTLMIIRRGKAGLAWCPDCRAEVTVITVDDAGHADPITAAQWLDAGKLHWWQPANGPAQICAPSLLQCFESEQLQEFLRSQTNSTYSTRRKQK